MKTQTCKLDGNGWSTAHPAAHGTHYTRTWGGGHGRSGQVLKIWSPPAFELLTVQLVASRYADNAMERVETESVRSQFEELARH